MYDRGRQRDLDLHVLTLTNTFDLDRIMTPIQNIQGLGSGSLDRPRRRQTKQQQRGAALMWVMISLVIFSIPLIASARSDARKAVAASGAAIGQQMLDINKALGSYSANTSVVTALRATPMGVVSGIANILSPTVAELKSLVGLDVAVSVLPFNGGSFKTQIVLLPSGCVASACNVATRLWMSNPLVEVGGKLDIGRIGSAIGVIGGNGGYSVPNNASSVSGSSGWTLTNPDTVSPGRAGILMAINGAGSNVDANYVHMNDARDPNLQGNLTVAGQIVLAGTATSGATCSPAGAMMRDATTGVLLMCNGSKWASVSGVINSVVAGAACSTPGLVGTSANSVGFMCRGGYWVATKSLVPLTVEIARYIVQDQTVVPQAVCDAGGVPAYDLIPISVTTDLTTTPPSEGTQFGASVSGSSWIASIKLTSSSGTTSAGSTVSGLFKSMCLYTQ